MSAFLDNDFVLANAHVPLSEIRRDISDTEAEILDMERQLPHLQGLAHATRDRLADMRARACSDGITQRKEFVRKMLLLIAHHVYNRPSDAESQL